MTWSVSGSLTHSKSKSNTTSSGSESTRSSTRRLDTAQEQELKNLLTQFGLDMQTDDAQFGKNAAIADASGLLNDLFTQYRENELPQILGAQGQSGAYGSTGAQILSNDAYARTVNKGAATILGNVQNYAAIQQGQRQNNIAAFSSVLEGLLGAKENTSVDSLFKTTSKTNSSGWSHNVSGKYGKL